MVEGQKTKHVQVLGGVEVVYLWYVPASAAGDDEVLSWQTASHKVPLLVSQEAPTIPLMCGCIL